MVGERETGRTAREREREVACGWLGGQVEGIELYVYVFTLKGLSKSLKICWNWKSIRSSSSVSLLHHGPSSLLCMQTPHQWRCRVPLAHGHSTVVIDWLVQHEYIMNLRDLCSNRPWESYVIQHNRKIRTLEEIKLLVFFFK